jgi:hypothetical protein
MHVKGWGLDFRMWEGVASLIFRTFEYLPTCARPWDNLVLIHFLQKGHRRNRDIPFSCGLHGSWFFREWVVKYMGVTCQTATRAVEQQSAHPVLKKHSLKRAETCLLIRLTSRALLTTLA